MKGEAAAPAKAKQESRDKQLTSWLKLIAKLRIDGRTKESETELHTLKSVYPALADEAINKELAVFEREWRNARRGTLIKVGYG